MVNQHEEERTTREPLKRDCGTKSEYPYHMDEDGNLRGKKEEQTHPTSLTNRGP